MRTFALFLALLLTGCGGTTTSLGMAAAGDEKSLIDTGNVHDLVYRRAACTLSSKGYRPVLEKVVSLNDGFWKDESTTAGTDDQESAGGDPADEDIPEIALSFEEEVEQELLQTFGYDEASLQAIDADAILFITYVMYAHSPDIAEQADSVDLTRLDIDRAAAQFLLVAPYPDFRKLFSTTKAYVPSFRRESMDTVVNNVIWATLPTLPGSPTSIEVQFGRCEIGA